MTSAPVDLQDAAHDVDRGVVAVEQRGGGDETHLVLRLVRGQLLGNGKIGHGASLSGRWKVSCIMVGRFTLPAIAANDDNRANSAKMLELLRSTSKIGQKCRVAPTPTSPDRTQATVAMGFVTGMLAGLQRRHIDPAPLLAATGIDIADTASRIPVERYAALYNLLNRELDDEGFGLFAQPMRVGSFEFLCRGCLSAPTLAEALTRATRFLRVVLPDLAVSVRRSHGRAELVIAETRKLAEDTDDPGRVFAFEWLLRLLHGLSCWLAGRGIGLDSVIFPYRRPAHSADYALIFTEDSRFAPTVPGGIGTLVASFNANLLDLPIRRDEAALTAFLDGAPGKITTLYRRDREMVIRVRDLLRAALPDTPGLDDIAGTPAPVATHHPPPPGRRRLQLSRHQGCPAPRHGAGPTRPRPATPSPRSPPISATPTPRLSIALSSSGPAWRRFTIAGTGQARRRLLQLGKTGARLSFPAEMRYALHLGNQVQMECFDCHEQDE